MPLRVGVIGCGAQGRNHLRAYRRLEDVEIAGICDSDPARLDAAGSEFAVEQRYGDYRQLLEAQRFDLLSICTMPVSHREMTVAALEQGAHVLCEKPMALDAAEAEAMARAARQAGRFLTVGFNMRYMRSAQALRRFVADGQLGRPVYTRAWTMATDIPWWGKHYVKSISGGGVLASTAVHILDLALWVAGNPTPVSASASMTRLFPRKRGATAPSPEAAAAYDVEDMLSGHIRFADGTWMTLEGAWCWDGPSHSYSFEMVGEAAAVQFEPARVVAEQNGLPVDITAATLAEEDRRNSWPQSVADQIADLVAAVREGREPLVRLEQALTVQRLVDALYRSAETGQEVALGLQ